MWLVQGGQYFNHTSAYFGIYLNYYFAAFMHYLTLIFLPSSFNRTDMVNKLESLCSKVSNLKNPQYGYYCCKSFFPAYFYNWKISRYSESWLVSKNNEGRVTLLYTACDTKCSSDDHAFFQYVKHVPVVSYVWMFVKCLQGLCLNARGET